MGDVLTRDQTSTRLTDLRRKLKARESTPGYAANVEALRAEIARLEEELNTLDG